MTDAKQVRTRKLVAADLLDTSHPLHKAFIAFCGDNPPSKRQARKFLQHPKHANYRDIDVKIE